MVIAGLTYGAMAVVLLSHVDEIASTLEMVKATEHKEFGFASIEDWKGGARINAWLYFTVGLTATICGAGIAARREWARLSWLVVSTLLLGFVLFVAVRDSEVSVSHVELLAFSIPSLIVLRRRLAQAEDAI